MRKVYLSVLIVLLTVCAMAVSLAQWGVVNCMLETGTAGIREIPDLAELLSNEQLEKERNLARWYNWNLYGEAAGEGIYETLLNFGAGRMGYLELPGTEQALPIVHESPSAILAAVHCYGTALPIGGRGNCPVLCCAGINLTEGELFRIHILGEILTYQVTEQGKSLPGITREDLCILDVSTERESCYIIAVRVETAEGEK